MSDRLPSTPDPPSARGRRISCGPWQAGTSSRGAARRTITGMDGSTDPADAAAHLARRLAVETDVSDV
jgi:hypothetical protein